MTISDLNQTDDGNYSVIVSNPYGSRTGNDALVTTLLPPTIAQQPENLFLIAGSTASFTVEANGTAPLAYQWMKNGNNIVGATGKVLQLPAVDGGDAGHYSVQINSPYGSATSDSASLSVGVPPTLTSEPMDKNASVGESASFDSNATGSTPMSYQWQYKGTNIPGAVSPTYNIPMVKGDHNGTYRVVVKNDYGTAISRAAKLTPIFPPFITSQPSDYNATIGTNVNFTVVADSITPLTYQWQKDGEDIIDANSSTHVINNAQVESNGTYSVIISNSAGSVTSRNGTLNIVYHPSIKTHPKDINASEGSNITFTVDANGSPTLAYQWQKDGVDIPNANSTSYHLTNAQGDANGTYRVVVTNPFDSTTSDDAKLAVGKAPAFTTHPSTIDNAAVGSAVSFSVVATGSGMISYQWQKDNQNLGDANASTYVISNSSVNSGGDYRAIASNPFGSTISQTAQLTVGYKPEIFSSPVDTNATEGGDVTFTVDSNGSGLISYQWQKDNIDIPGATFKTLSLQNINTSDSGSYRVVANNKFGSTNSDEASLVILGAPTITSHPQSGSTPLGANVTLSVEASGTSPLSYQWLKNNIAINGATSAEYTINNIEANDEGSYHVVVTNPYGSKSSSEASVLVGLGPIITVQPIDQNSTGNKNIYFRIGANGTRPMTFQWKKDGENVDGLDVFTISEYMSYYSTGGRKWYKDSNGSWCYLTADGSLYRRGAASSIGSDFWTNPSGLVGINFLMIKRAGAASAGSYRCIASNKFGSKNSQEAKLVLVSPPEITAHPENTTLSIGANATLSVEASGDDLSYQWTRNGNNIVGASDGSYTINNAQANNAGSYICVVTNPHGSVSSHEAKVTVNAPPVIITHPVSQSVKPAANVTFFIEAESTSSLSYQWKKDGADMTGTGFMIAEHLSRYDSSSRKWFRDTEGRWCYLTPQGKLYRNKIASDLNSSYWNNPSLLFGLNFLTLANVDSSDAGTYTCVVSNSLGNSTSNGAIIQIAAPPVIIQQPTNLSVENNANATLSITASGVSLTYQWQKDGVDIPSSTTPSHIIPNVQSEDAGAYRCVVSNPHGSATSQTANLTVKIPPVISVHPIDDNVSANSNVTFSIIANGAGTLTYQWRKNGVNINGGTGISIIEHLAAYDSNKRKWLRDGDGRWCYINPQGVLYHRGKQHNFGSEYWTNPSLLFGPNYFMLNGIQATDEGAYSCVVSTEFGSTQSSAAVLTISAPPTFTIQPSSQSGSIGANITLNVGAAGKDVTYQWQKDSINIGGANNPTLLLTSVQASDSGIYRCVASNAQGSATSSTATVTVMSPPTITTQPAGISTTKGNSVIFTVSAAGPGTLSYQWQKNNVNINNGTGVQIVEHISKYDSSRKKWLKDSQGNWCYIRSTGELYREGTRSNLGVAYWNNPKLLFNLNLLTLPRIQSSEAGIYRCIISNAGGSVTSQAATLTVNN